MPELSNVAINVCLEALVKRNVYAIWLNVFLSKLDEMFSGLTVIYLHKYKIS